MKKNGWIPTGFFQYNGIGLANGLYRRIRKDDDTASSEPFVESVTEEVHKHHSSHWQLPSRRTKAGGLLTCRQTILAAYHHTLFYSTTTHELDANLLRSVLGTLVSLNAPSVGPVQQAHALLLDSLADNGELWDEKVKIRLKSGVRVTMRAVYRNLRKVDRS